MAVVYELSADEEYVNQMQDASVNRPDLGLVPDPLVGGPEWWNEIKSGGRPTHHVEGTIVSAYWAGMGDWPEFRIRAADGAESTWTRQGDVRRYVEGLRAQVEYVEHAWKRGGEAAMGLGDASKIVLRITVEDSPLRSAAVAPGPGGAGYELARREGDVTHYLRFTSEEAARRVEQELADKTESVRTYHDRFSGSWFVQVWHRDASSAERWRSELQHLLALPDRCYDGGEIVGGDVWGPSAAGGAAAQT